MKENKSCGSAIVVSWGSWSAAFSVNVFFFFPSDHDGCLGRAGSDESENAQDAQLPAKTDQGGAEPQAQGSVYPRL